MTAAAPLLELAIEVAGRAGALLRASSAGAVQTKSTATDPVTEADRGAEQLIVDALAAARPDDGLVGEEGASRRGSTGLRWVVDPLDGTVNFLYGIPVWAVSIACEDDTGALVGVVHDVPAGRMWTAARGGGAACDGVPIAVNDPVALDRALVATGFAYDAAVRTRQAATLALMLPVVRDVRRLGSAALDLCAVAGGQADAYYESTTARWDWAAGALVASEAGAVVTGYGDGVVAAGPSLHGPLCAALGIAADTPLP